MPKITTKAAPRFQRPSNSYPTNFSESNYSPSAHNLKKIKFRISIRGPLTRTEKIFRNRFLVQK